MALSDLAVFSRYVYRTMTEVQDQAIDKFNQSSRGGLVLTAGNNQGDFDDEIIWAKIQNLVKRRDAYGSGALEKRILTQLVNTSVKVAAGTYPVEIDPGMLKWIKKSPQEAGVVVGQQMAQDRVADMLNTAIMAYVATVGSIPELVNDVSNPGNDPADSVTASLRTLNRTAQKMGDRAQSIVCWLVHSTPMFDLHDKALENENRLFSFGTVNIWEDGFGRTFIVTDSPSLFNDDPAGDGSVEAQYYTLGLTAGAALVETNNDEYTDNIDTTNGDENIQSTYQAEWTYNLGVKGFSYDKSQGGSPDDSIIGAGGNWERTSTSYKDMAGVMLISN